jgi:hypothetical protein
MIHARDDYQDIQQFPASGTKGLIPQDEPVFLLRAQDRFAADAVRCWADMAEAGGADADIVRLARRHAEKMDAWPKKKTPDMLG